jgi:hypothetical protein
MGSITVDPVHPQTIYAGTGQANYALDSIAGQRILKSTDGGARWTLIGQNQFTNAAVSKIVVDPTNDKIVYAAVTYPGPGRGPLNTGIWKSLDGGTTWTDTTLTVEPTSSAAWTDLVMDPANDLHLFATIGDPLGSTANGLYETIDGGQNWVPNTGGGTFPTGATDGRIQIAISPQSAHSSVMYAAISQPGTNGLDKFLRTLNGGISWDDLTTNVLAVEDYLSPNGSFDSTLAVDPQNPAVVFAGGAANGNAGKIIATVNGTNLDPATVTFADINSSTGPGPDHHAIAFDANNDLVVGTDSGVWLLSNPASNTNWTNLNTTLSTSLLNTITIDANNPNLVYAGSQGNGIDSTAGPQAWDIVQAAGLDGASLLVDPSSSSILYHNGFNFFERSDDGGVTWNQKISGINTTSLLPNQVLAFAIDPNQPAPNVPARLILATNQVYISLNRGDTWNAVSGPPPTWSGATATQLAISPADSHTFYALLSNGSFQVSHDGGLTWKAASVPNQLPLAAFAIGPNTSQGDVIFAVSQNGGPQSVFESNNGGTGFADITGNLGPGPVHTVAFDPQVPGGSTPTPTIFIGNDLGVYASQDNGVTWKRWGSGLPNVPVAQLYLNPTLHILGAATRGRGAWRLVNLEPGFTVTANATTTAGHAFIVTVAALNQFNQVDPSFSGTIHFSSSDQGIGRVLPGDYQFQAGDNGVHTFTLGTTLVTAGRQTIQVNDIANTTHLGSASVLVQNAPFDHLGFTAPATATAGAGFPVTVTAQDAFNNTVLSFADQVAFSSNSSGAILPPTYTFQSTDQGVHTFIGVTFFAAQSTHLTVTDKSNKFFATDTISVSGAAASHLTLVAPGNTTAGAPFTVTVKALDPFNNIAANYSDIVQFVASGAIVLPGPYQFTSSDQGVHTFTNGVNLTRVTPNSQGLPVPQTMVVYDTAIGSINGTANVTVNPGPLAQFQIVVPAISIVGAVSTVTVTAQDAFGNTVPNYMGTIHFTTTDPRGILPADYTFVGSDNGTHSFPDLVILRTLGTQTITATDRASGTIAGFSAEIVSPRPTPALLAVGADSGTPPEVKLINPVNGSVVMDFMAYDPNFLGGVRVAMGDINADGVPDLITAPGPTGGPDIRVWDGKSGKLIREFAAYSMRFTGGVFVAAGDINNDGYADIITGAGASGGPEVDVWSGQTGQKIRAFYAYDPLFAGGVHVAAGDVTGDGIPDIITAAGPGGGPHVEVFDGVSNALVRSFYAYDPHFTGGVYVSAADANGDGRADIVTGAGAGGGPHVEVWSGLTGALLQSFYAYNPSSTGGARVEALDVNGDGHALIITAPGAGTAPLINVFSNQVVLDSFFAFNSNDSNGVFVGGA